MAIVSSPAGAQGEPPLYQKPEPVKIILVGDSTTSQHTGWGGAFCDLHVADTTACLTMGRGGSSTKTYRVEGSWDLVLGEVRVSGYLDRYVLIELGHNDKSADPAIGTALEDEFPRNLARFVEEIRAAGGFPILLTPLAARHFHNGRLADSLRPWAERVRSAAARTMAPVVDLNHMSGVLYQRLGAVGTLGFERRSPTNAEHRAAMAGTTLPARLPMSTPVSDATPADDPRRAYSADYVHLNQAGAEQVAALVAKGVLAAVPALKQYVLP